MKLSSNLRVMRIGRRLTMKRIAALIGVPVSTYRDWEYGSKIPAEQLQNIAKILEIPISELFGEEIDPNKKKLLALLEEALQLVRITR
jgi:transcriptional regulator with XRE-family HTH domain